MVPQVELLKKLTPPHTGVLGKRMEHFFWWYITNFSEEEVLAHNEIAIESHVAGNIWQVLVEPGQHVNEGEPLVILESMKMEIEVTASEAGTIQTVIKQEGSQVAAGSRLLVMQLDEV